MHTDIDALSVVCSHYREYESQEVRRLINKARRLERALLREQNRRILEEVRSEAWRKAAQGAEVRYSALLTAVRRLGR